MGHRHPLCPRVSTVQAHIAKSVFNVCYTTLNGCTVVIALIRALLNEQDIAMNNGVGWIASFSMAVLMSIELLELTSGSGMPLVLVGTAALMTATPSDFDISF